jgi:hypothetical protein
MQGSSIAGQRSRCTVIYVLIFVLCCLLSSGREVWDARRGLRNQAQSNNPARHADERFAAIKAALPERGIVGYVGEPGALALGDYYAAQYALAPLVVEHSTNHAMVIGNFSSSQTAFSAGESSNLQLVKDYGNGVLLLANKGAN